MFIRVFVQHGTPDVRDPDLPGDCDHLRFRKRPRWDSDYRQERAAVGTGIGEAFDHIEGSDGPIGLGSVAGYFDYCARLEPEDFNSDANIVAVSDFDLGNLGVRHG